jgi:hypothetical protein
VDVAHGEGEYSALRLRCIVVAGYIVVGANSTSGPLAFICDICDSKASACDTNIHCDSET